MSFVLSHLHEAHVNVHGPFGDVSGLNQHGSTENEVQGVSISSCSALSPTNDATIDHTHCSQKTIFSRHKFMSNDQGPHRILRTLVGKTRCVNNFGDENIACSLLNDSQDASFDALDYTDADPLYPFETSDDTLFEVRGSLAIDIEGAGFAKSWICVVRFFFTQHGFVSDEQEPNRIVHPMVEENRCPDNLGKAKMTASVLGQFQDAILNTIVPTNTDLLYRFESYAHELQGGNFDDTLCQVGPSLPPNIEGSSFAYTYGTHNLHLQKRVRSLAKMCKKKAIVGEHNGSLQPKRRRCAPAEKPQRNVWGGETNAVYAEVVSNLASVAVPTPEAAHSTMKSHSGPQNLQNLQSAIAADLGKNSGLEQYLLCLAGFSADNIGVPTSHRSYAAIPVHLAGGVQRFTSNSRPAKRKSVIDEENARLQCKQSKGNPATV